jgi:hypothetical protein
MKLLLVLGALLGNLALIWPATLAVAAQEEIVVVPTGERWEGDLATVARSIVVEGEVRGDVTSWSGDIAVRGRVLGDIVSYGGVVELGPQAEVSGSILALAGGVSHAATAQVGGQEFAPQLQTTATSLAGFVGVEQARSARGLRLIATAGGALLLLGMTLLLPAIWPLRSRAMALMLRRRPWQSLGLGLLSGLLLALLLAALAGLLALTLLGVTLLPPLVLLAHLFLGVGVVAVALAVERRLGPTPRAPAGLSGGLLLILPLALLATLAPGLGLALFYLVGCVGLGAVALSRGGTLLLPD